MALGYDAQGNAAFKNGSRYRFDMGKRLRDTAGETYRYDAEGRRVRSERAGGQVRESDYAKDGRLMWQRDEVAGQRRVNVYLSGSLVADYSRPLAANTVTVSYIHTDALGSPIAKTDVSGAVIETSEYEPYGKLLNRPNDDRAGYTGHVMDSASGLTYMQQRYYDPMGVFLSVDPVTAYSNPVGAFNRYRYGNSNPYRFKDPDGRQSYGYGTNQPDKIKDCNQTGTCRTPAQTDAMLKRDAQHVATAVAVPAAVGAGAAVTVATGAVTTTTAVAGRVATAAEAKYTTLGITAVATAQKVSAAVSTTAVRVATATTQKATELYQAAITSAPAVASMKYREELTDFVQGFVDEMTGADGPTTNRYEILGGVTAGAVNEVRDP